MFLSIFDFSPLWAHPRTRAREQVDDACPLARMAALSMDAKQAKKAEWYTAYPNERPSGLPKHDAKTDANAKALPPPRPRPHPRPRPLPLRDGKDDRDSRAGAGALRHLDAREFSAFAAITCSAVGSGRATMSMIADVARQELRWQLHVMQPLCVGLPVPVPVDEGDEDEDEDEDKAAADDAERRHGGLPIPGSPVSTRALSPELVVVAAAAAPHVPAAHLDGLHDDHMSGKKKRKRSASTTEEVTDATDHDSPRPPPEKRAKRGSETNLHQHQHQHRDSSHNHVHNAHRGRSRSRNRSRSRSRSDRGTRDALDDASSREGPEKPPTGPAAAFLYALGMQSAARQRTEEERRRGAGKWR